MHRFSSPALLFALLNHQFSEARPAPQADAAPCSTIVNLPQATLTISPGPSNAVVNGFPDGATSTIEANGPAITVGPDVLSLNADNNVDLNGFVFLFSDNFCPAFVIPITTLPTSSESTALVPVPGPTDTPEQPPTDPEPVPDPSPPENPDTPVDPPSDPPEDPPSEDPVPPVVPIPIPTPVVPIPVPDPNPVDPVPNPDDPVPAPVDPVPEPVDPVPAPVDPVPVPDPVDPIPVPVPDPVDPVDPVPVPDPVDPTITPPPSPPPPNNEDPNECETQTANVCTQGCSFGTNFLGVTTTTSCKDPTCTATTACGVSDTTSTTTIEAPACSLDLNGGVASGYPFPVDGNGPLPRADAPTVPAPADPQPTPSEPATPPSEPETPPSEPEEPPSQPEEPPSEPEEPPSEPTAPSSPPQDPTTLVFEAGKLTAGDGTESIVIYSHARDLSLNICNDTPFYKESTLVGLSKKFDIPDSEYKNCDFVGIGSDPLGINCEGKDRLPCVVLEGSRLESCLAGNNDVFGVTWVCNE